MCVDMCNKHRIVIAKPLSCSTFMAMAAQDRLVAQDGLLCWNTSAHWLVSLLELLSNLPLQSVSPLPFLLSHDHIEIMSSQGELLFFRQRDGPYIPTLRLLHKCGYSLGHRLSII